MLHEILDWHFTDTAAAAVTTAVLVGSSDKKKVDLHLQRMQEIFFEEQMKESK